MSAYISFCIGGPQGGIPGNLLQAHGEFQSGAALWRALGYPSERPFQPAAQLRISLFAFDSNIGCRGLTALAAFEECSGVQSQPVTVFYEPGGYRVRYTPNFRVSLSLMPGELAVAGVGQKGMPRPSHYISGGDNAK